MSLWQIAARNIWQNRGRYIAYLASSAFAVMIFFLYSALIHHPELQGGYRGAGYALQGMKAAAVVIAIFTFLFLLYSNSAFVRSRMKEFGLLSLLGVARGQLVGIILFESLIVAAVAIASGLGAGLLFLKLFFMAISALLRLPEQIPFYAGPQVWIQTVAVFGAFFVLVSLFSLRSVLQRNIIELVRAGRQPKTVPTFSRWKAVLGLCLLLGGYLWASFPNVVVVVLGIMPVTTMVSFGTYFLMSEGSIAFLTWLHRRERYFYRPGPFLSVSQLVYKMQDNYRVLTAVALLVAVILTAVGTAFTTYVLVTQDTRNLYPHAVQLVQTGSADPAALVTKVESVLRSHGITDLSYKALVTRTARLEQAEEQVFLMPYSFYATTQRPNGKTLPLEMEDGAIFVHSFLMGGEDLPNPPEADRLVVDGQSLPVHVIDDYSGRVLNVGPDLAYGLVLPDATFTQLMQQVPAEQQIQAGIWDGDNWKGQEMERALAELRPHFQAEVPNLSLATEAYHTSMSSMGLLLFIGGFVSLVFFAASFSLLYFRLFTEIDEDRKYYRRLQQVGVSTRELKRLALGQAAVIFFAPFMVGLIHSTFAMKALGALAGKTVLQYGWMVALVYLLLYGLCFGGTCAAYWRSLRAGLTGPERLGA